MQDEPSQYQHTQVATNDLIMITFLRHVLVRVCDDYYLTISMLLLAVLNSQDRMHDETAMSTDCAPAAGRYRSIRN